MKFIRFLIFLIITGTVIFFLNKKTGPVPPLGRFLDPQHGFWQNLDPIDYPEDYTNLPVSEPVTIQFDQYLIPHIHARNESDLYMAQGFITSFYRSFQMEAQTRVASGTLAAVFGEGVVGVDRRNRRMGLGFAAERALENYKKDPEMWAYLKAYAKGVNTHLESLAYKNLPIEFKLLDFEPSQWSPKHTAYLLTYMSNNLVGWDRDLENTFSLQKFGRDTFNLLYPEHFPGERPVAPENMPWNFEPLPTPARPSVYPPVIHPDTEPSEDTNPDNGSNNFAVSASKSSSGFPILANDPHLSLNLPSIWMAMHLQAPGINTMGVSLQGTLGCIIGFNEDISWGVTNATRDLRDWYLIELNEDGTQYKFNDTWMPLKKRIETIEIRGSGSQTDTVYYTHHGPIVYDKHYKSREHNQALALRWSAHEPYMEAKTFVELNKGKNFEDYRKALSHYNVPAQNFIFASKEGDIAITVNGAFPIKWEEQGKFIMDGTQEVNDWQMAIPRNHLVAVKNPERGYVSSANQIPVDTLYPYYVYDANYEHWRNRMINNALDTMESITPVGIQKLQANNYSLKAEEFTALILEKVAVDKLSTDEKFALDLFRKWNFYYEPESPEPAIFNEWLDSFMKLAWDEMIESKVPLRVPDVYATYHLMKKYPELPFWENKSLEGKQTLADLITLAWQNACKKVMKGNEALPPWYEFKNTQIKHLLPLDPFHRNYVKVGGDKNIINATSSTHGASWRMVVTWDENGPIAKGIYPGGQSGNPASEFYDNLIDIWSKGELVEFNMNPEINETKQIILKSEDK